MPITVLAEATVVQPAGQSGQPSGARASGAVPVGIWSSYLDVLKVHTSWIALRSRRADAATMDGASRDADSLGVEIDAAMPVAAILGAEPLALRQQPAAQLPPIVGAEHERWDGNGYAGYDVRHAALSASHAASRASPGRRMRRDERAGQRRASRGCGQRRS